MTLLIALLLLHHMGWFNHFTIIGTLILWVLHYAAHDDSKK